MRHHRTMFGSYTGWSRVLMVCAVGAALVSCSTGTNTPSETTTTTTAPSSSTSVTPVTPVTPGTNPPATPTPTAPGTPPPSTPVAPGEPPPAPTASSTPSTYPSSFDEGTSGAATASESSDMVASGSSESSSAPSADPEVRFIGRVQRAGETATFAWSGTGIVAAFEGTSVSVQLNDSGSNQFTVLVDDTLQPLLDTQSGSHSYPLATGLVAGRHTVQIYRRTEANQGETTFEGFDFGSDGAL